MIATIPSTHTHQHHQHQHHHQPPSYTTLMQEEGEQHLRSRFSVSTVGSPRPISSYAATHRGSYAPYPAPSAPAPHSHRVSVSSRRGRHQNSSSPRQSSDSTYSTNNNISNNRESISARDSFVHFSDSDSDPSSPSSPPSSPSVYSVPSCDSHKSAGSGSGSGSGSGHSCPPTPNQGIKVLHSMNENPAKLDVKERRASADSDGDGAGYLLRPSSITLGIGLPTPASRTPSLYLPATSLPAPFDLPDSAPAHQSPFVLNSESNSPSRASSLVIRTRDRASGSDDLRRLTVQDLREHDLTYLDDLDRVDNRQDGERIIAQTLERNSLLMTNRVSVLTAASVSAESLYSQGTVRSLPGTMPMNVAEVEEAVKVETEDVKEEIDPSRLSVLTCASGYTYATSRASVQTYGSSVLTYGSLASRPQSPVEDDVEADSSGVGAENRPVHPLPWNPRPSAVSRIVRQKKGPRPLPPLPAKNSAEMMAPSASSSTSMKRKPRPLPRPPSQVPPLENIAEVPTPAASEESHQQRHDQEQHASMCLSPSALNFSPSARRGSRRRSVRYSALASTYGYPGRRGSISGPAGAGDASVGLSRASSFRTGGGMSVSGCEVPDVDELVRILDEVDFRKRGSSSRSSRVRIGRSVEAWRRGRSDVSSPTSPLSPGELNMGDALEDTRGCVAVPGGGIARNAPNVPSIGLPTPAATPKPRTPPKVVEPLPLPLPVSALLSLPIPPPPSVAAPKPMSGNAASTQSSLLSPPDAPPGSTMCPTPSSSFLYSPMSGVSAPMSHMSFPLPPEELEIMGPDSVSADDVPVPTKAQDEDGEVTPSTGVRLSFAEKATLPGLALSFVKAIGMGKRDTVSTPPPPPVPVKPATKASPGKHTSTQDAINDLRNRVSALGRSLPILSLPVPLNPKPIIHMTRVRGASTSEYLPGVPRLMQPVPPVRRRATSSACPVNTDLLPPPVPEKDAVREKAEEKLGSRHPYAAKPRPAEIDIKAANNYEPSRVPPSAFKIPPTGEGSGSFSAPAVAPLRFRSSRRGSELGVTGMNTSTLAPLTATPGPGPLTGSSVIGIAPSSGRPSTSEGTTGYTTSSTATFLMSATPPSSVPSTATITRPATAEAMTTSFSVVPVSGNTKPQRSASVVYGSSSTASIPPVAPLRFRNSKSSIRSRMRSATVTGATGDSSNNHSVKVSEDKVEVKPDSTLLPTLFIPEDAEEVCGTNTTMASTETTLSERRARMKQELIDNEAIGPELANIIHSIADADPDSQMASLLTIASSINSERQDFNFGGVSPQKGNVSSDGVDVDEPERSSDPNEKRDRRSTQSSLSSDRRRSEGRSVNSVRLRSSARSSRHASRDNLRIQRTSASLLTAELKNLAPVDPAALKALPDPNTFPIPLPTLGSPAPKIVDTSIGADTFGDLSSFLKPSPLPKLKVITKFKGDTVLLPSSQAPLSAVSTKSTMSTMSTMSGISAFGHSVGLGSRVRGPRKMNRMTLSDPRSPMTDAAAAAAALVERFKQKRADIASRGPQGGVQRRHQRTGSKDGSGRSRMPLTGSGFFGSSVRAFPDPVLRSARPTIRRPRADRTSAEVDRSSDLFLVSNE